MIKLTKLEEPNVLKQNGAEWLSVLEGKLASGENVTATEKARYRHPEIKAALKAETHGKCAYCESFLLHVTFGDVEHVIPKSSDIKQTFRWENLTLACDVCNTHKGSANDIIDPYKDNLINAFNFVGPMVFPRSENAKAVLTAKKLRLNRRELIERRSERLRTISDQILLMANVKDKNLKATLKEDIEINETSDDKEFAAFVRSLLLVLLPEVV